MDEEAKRSSQPEVNIPLQTLNASGGNIVINTEEIVQDPYSNPNKGEQI
jgi:hypothetical protein